MKDPDGPTVMETRSKTNSRIFFCGVDGTREAHASAFYCQTLCVLDTCTGGHSQAKDKTQHNKTRQDKTKIGTA